MKRYMAILGFVFVGVLAGLLVRGIPIVLHVNAGGEAVATQNGDVNGDSMLDMSDAVYLLIHLFNGGPEPAAFAQMEPADLRGVEDSLESIAYNFDRFVGTQCEQRLDRFVWQENRTVIDTCKELMWMDSATEFVDATNNWVAVNFDEALAYANDLVYAGYSDWRLPTLSEAASILNRSGELDTQLSATLPPFSFRNVRNWNTSRIWTSTRNDNSAWQVNVFPIDGNNDRRHRFYVTPLGQRTVNATKYGAIFVRDIGLDE